MRSSIFAFFLFLSLPAHSQISVLELSGDPFFGPLMESISPYLNTNGPINITVRHCGEINAWWDGKSEITFCQEVSDLISSRVTSAAVSGEINAETAAAYSLGARSFIIFHELAHALIQRHRIAFTGRNEDTADQFAAYIMMRLRDPRYYIGSMTWLGKQQLSTDLLTGEHSLDIQRMTQLACWGYGRSPRLFYQIVANLKVSPHRLRRCAMEYRDLMANTPRVFDVILSKEKGRQNRPSFDSRTRRTTASF